MSQNYKIRNYLAKLNPKILGFDKISSVSVKSLGLGESNLNYLATVNGKKFIVRINIDVVTDKRFNNSKKEFDSLKTVENLGIAPKAFRYETSSKYFGKPFIIVEYLEGKTLDSAKTLKLKETSNKTTKELAEVIAKLHKTHLKVRLAKTDVKSILKHIKIRLDYIRKKRKKYALKNAFDDVLTKTCQNFNPKKLITKNYVLGHGDIAPQNVIKQKVKLKLIDWEDLSLIDPALEIARVFDSFDFSQKQRNLFLKEYLNIRKDPAMEKRIKLFWPFQLLNTFVWAVMHVFEIAEQELVEEFTKAQKLKNHIDYAEKVFNKCKDAGMFEYYFWNAKDVFPEKYLK